MKKLLSISLALIICFTPVLMQVHTVEAGAPKLIYEVGETVVESAVKAIQARKGFKVIDGGEVANEVVTETFTGAMKKGLQDSLTGAWQTIKGATLSATPLKNAPQWLKVVVGTTAFVTGADLVIDMYDKVVNGEDLEYVDNVSVTVPYKQIADIKFYAEKLIAIGGAGSSYFGFHVSDIPEIINYPEGSEYVTGSPSRRYILPDNMIAFTIGVTTNWTVEEFAQQVGPVFYYLAEYAGDKIALFFQNGKGENIRIFDDVRGIPGFDVGIATQPIPHEKIQIQEVPKIDTTKETQTLIIPNPDYVTDIDQAIADNPDIVLDPDKFLRDNPHLDPSPETNPDPGTDPGTDLPPGSINFMPLKDAVGDITTKFPFSIPWDFARLLSVFDVAPKTPKFEIDAGETVTVAGFEIPVNYEFTLDFAVFDPVAKIVRWALILIFDIAAILMLRRLTPD